MPAMSAEKEWEIRRMASKVVHSILTEAGSIEDARMVAALTLNIMLKPVPMPAERAAELVRLAVVGA